jgi:hypothetical protein
MEFVMYMNNNPMCLEEKAGCDPANIALICLVQSQIVIPASGYTKPAGY